LAVIALVVASLFVFTACGGEDYKFDALENNPAASAPVSSNGGSYVQKGEYSYFINGAEDGTDKNTFGTYHKGSIVRVKTSDLTKKERVVETVVPKIIYAEEANSSGFYIYGDKIYYTTPNSGKDTQGNVQMTKLDFMMANINGTGTKIIATVDDNTQAFRFIQNNEKVYLLYVGTADVEINEQKTSTTAIYQVDCDTKEQKPVADNVEAVVFDKYANSNSVAYTKKVVTEGIDGKQVVETEGNNLYKYTAGSEKAVEIKKGVDIDNLQYTKYTPVALSNGVVYFNSEAKGLAIGSAFNKVVGTTVTKLSNNTYTNIFVDNANQDVIYTQQDGYITKITFANESVSSSVKLCAETQDIEFEYIHDGYVYYSLVEQYVLNRVSATEEFGGSEKAIVGQMKTTLWASYDFAEIDGKLCVFYFNDMDGIKFINYLYASIIENDEDDIKYETKRIGYLSKNEQNYAIEEGDDSYAVDEFTSAE
ncbi:MAG: hypothetical protein IKA90_00270, partial [Clostridia bacterium]|nr:hypothetical protein [Clostridia bacterium]